MTTTTIPTANSHFRVGSMPLCLALGSADIGRARVGNRWHYTTWGRNLDPNDLGVIDFLHRSGFEAIRLGSPDIGLMGDNWRSSGFEAIRLGSPDSLELIIPDEMIAPIFHLIHR